MAIYTTTLNSNLSSLDYSQINDLIGQLKNIFLMSPHVLTISDNNAIDGSVKRDVTLKVGDSSHYIRLEAGDKLYGRLYIQNSANTGRVESSNITLQNSPLKFLYNDHNFVCNIWDGITFSRGEDNHWYTLTYTGSSGYYWNSDAKFSFNAFDMSLESIEGDSILCPAYAYSSKTFFLFFNYVFKGLLNATNDSFYYDGTSYYYCRNGGYLFKDE